LIVTTEKDYVRIKDQFLAEQLYYLPIQSSFLGNKSDFDETIANFVCQFLTK
jgi:tetraacyldisaccharide 4'-kinase